MLSSSAAHLKITGFKHQEVVENIFASSMVNVAYVVEANERHVLVVGEEIENRSSEYKSWLMCITIETLKHEGQSHLKVEVLGP